MKLALVVYLAHWFAKRGLGRPRAAGRDPPVPRHRRRRSSCSSWLEPDLGTASVLAFTAFTMFFLAGANLLHLAGMAVAAVPAVAADVHEGLPDGPDHGLAGPLPHGRRPGLPQRPGVPRARARRGRRRGPRREPARGRPVPAQRVQRLHLRDHRRGVRPAGRRPRDRPVPRVRLPRDPDEPRRAGHLRRAARRGDHVLDLHPGVHQHRGRRRPHPGHRHPAARS